MDAASGVAVGIGDAVGLAVGVLDGVAVAEGVGVGDNSGVWDNSGNLASGVGVVVDSSGSSVGIGSGVEVAECKAVSGVWAVVAVGDAVGSEKVVDDTVGFGVIVGVTVG